MSLSVNGLAVRPSNEFVAPAVTTPARTLRFGRHRYPVILPKVRDARLHVAAVVITIHVLGQIGLHFRVSVPQILAAVLTTAILGVVVSFRQTKSFVWPASAMLTGSGIALILRVPGTPDDHWTTHGWYVFAGIAGFSLLTKYTIKYRGTHLFNPSNVGLVLAFLLFGSTRVEPLDFWWAPLNGWMITAYAVILVGGLVITARLKLLASAATFWVALAIGIGLLARSGHCITARWAFTPVCGYDFWKVIITSPEILIFLFFMITDPKTVPAGRVGRVMFGLLVAVVSVLMMAPQTTEFATKVALLGGLVLVCAFRPILDRLVPEPGTDDDRLGRFAVALVRSRDRGTGLLGGFVRGAIIAAVVAALGVGIVAAGASAHGVLGPDTEAIIGRVPHDVNPATFPKIAIDQGVLDWNHEISGAGAQQIVLTLAENLELETQALLRKDATILTAVDHGDRLDAMQLRLHAAETTGTTVTERYQFDNVHVTLLVPFGKQDGLSLGLESKGTVTKETRDAAGHLQSSASSPFATTFVVRRATGARWLNVAELAPGAKS
jgi:Na+-transporting NADH:ubiquinone oxidoreductase subunit NqrB